MSSPKKGIEDAKARLLERGLDTMPKGAAGFVGGDEKKWRYYAIDVYRPDAKRHPEYVLDAERRKLAGLEYTKAPDTVKQVGSPDSEVWQTPRELWEWRKRERKRQLAQQPWWAEQQMARSQRGHGFMPKPHELAEPTP